MGGLVIETVRPGVQFTPEAADAFRRADAQVLAEFGRRIDVNSTYRSWSDQMLMFTNWGKYVASGYRPSLYPGHSKAVHPSESFHVQGVALDSDDWRIARIVQILADNGFIRNRLHVPGENHHFEYLRARDKNYGNPSPAGGSDQGDEFMAKIDDIWEQWLPGKTGVKAAGAAYLLFVEIVTKVRALGATAAKAVWATPVNRGGKNVSALQEVADAKTQGITANQKLDQLLARPATSVELTDAQLDRMAAKVGEKVALTLAPSILDLMAKRLQS